MALLIVLMLLPWVWVYLGLSVLNDYRLTILMYEILGCLVPVLLLGGYRLPIWPLRFNLAWILLLATTIGSLIIIVFRISNGFSMNWTVFHAQAQATQLVVDNYFWFFAFIIVLVNPFLEEAFWRGLIYRAWRARIGTLGARWVSSFFFGAWHWVVLSHYCHSVWAVVLTILVMFGGVVFCILYERSGTLAAPALMHGLGADSPMIYVVYYCVTHAVNYPL